MARTQNRLSTPVECHPGNANDAQIPTSSVCLPLSPPDTSHLFLWNIFHFILIPGHVGPPQSSTYSTFPTHHISADRSNASTGLMTRKPLSLAAPRLHNPPEISAECPTIEISIAYQTNISHLQPPRLTHSVASLHVLTYSHLAFDAAPQLSMIKRSESTTPWPCHAADSSSPFTHTHPLSAFPLLSRFQSHTSSQLKQVCLCASLI